ncbi:Uncharacterized protein TCM_045934 [Theobroma cacao]|uniref:Uncharacterized protein n=1 Tax=Theobroma cacao TaxID=3641 RepID=S1SMG4_THECC|nr:Uncharacterized protein TCM_045934 [Theobroma cacao]
MWVMEKGRLCQGSWFLFHFGTALRLGRLLFILNGWIVVRTSCDRKVIIIIFFCKMLWCFPLFLSLVLPPSCSGDDFHVFSS